MKSEKLPYIPDTDLAGWWYSEYTGSLSLDQFLANYHSKMESR